MPGSNGPRAIWRGGGVKNVTFLVLVGAFFAVALAYPLSHVLIGAFANPDPDEGGYSLYFFNEIFGKYGLWLALALWLISAGLLVWARFLATGAAVDRAAIVHGSVLGLGPALASLFGGYPGLAAVILGLAAGGIAAFARPLWKRRGAKRPDAARGIHWGLIVLSVVMLVGGAEAESVEQGWLRNSFALGVSVTVLTVVIALPLAWITVRYRFPGKTLLSGLLLVPMIMPPFVGAIGMRRLLARYGSVNLLLMDLGLTDPESPLDILGGARFWGVVILEVLHLYPVMYLNLTAALANVDPSLEQAAQSMGDSGLRLFRKIILPLALPGLFAGGSIVFIWAFTDLGTPLVLEYQQVVAKQIFDRVREGTADRQAYALVVTVLAMTLLLFYLTKRALGTRQTAMLTKGAAASREISAPRSMLPLIYALFGGVTLLAVLPHLSVVATSLSDRWFMTVLPEQITGAHYQTAFTHPLTAGSIARSLGYSLASTAIDIVLGVAIAFYVSRSGSRLAPLIDGLAMLPLAIPGIVLAFGYVGAFSGLRAWLADHSMGGLGFLVDPKDFPVLLLVMSYSLRRLPFMVRAVHAGFQQTAEAYEEASLNLGAAPGATLRRITLPLIAANIVAGAILAFCFAMLEVSDSLILAVKSRFYPMTKAIWTTFGWLSTGENVASAMGVFGMIILTASLLLAAKFMGRKMGEMFRVG